MTVECYKQANAIREFGVLCSSPEGVFASLIYVSLFSIFAIITLLKIFAMLTLLIIGITVFAA